MKRPTLAGAVFYAVAITCATAAGQQETPPDQQIDPGIMPDPTPSQEDALSRDSVSTDTFVQHLALNDIFEIALSRLALQKSSNSEVQAFANRMIKDHTSSTERLGAILKAGNINIVLPTQIDPDHEKIIQSMQGMTGSEFDHTFARVQQQAHEKILLVLTRYRDGGRDKDLQAFATEIAKVVERHLADSKKLGRASM
jgi:putative membrane protein